MPTKKKPAIVKLPIALGMPSTPTVKDDTHRGFLKETFLPKKRETISRRATSTKGRDERAQKGDNLKVATEKSSKIKNKSVRGFPQWQSLEWSEHCFSRVSKRTKKK